MKVVEKFVPDVEFNFQEHLLGGSSIDATGSPLTDEALEAASNAHAILLGAIGGPKYGTGPVRPEQGMLRAFVDAAMRTKLAARTRPTFANRLQ